MSNIHFQKHARLIRQLFLLIIILSLTACATVKTDGPPPFDVDETKVPNATPKPERLSKYGNLPSYHVFGKKYQVMKSSKGYHEVGIASWYGRAFHGRPTSSGGRYNMLAMTAAHKSLPLPTYVEVTNIKNGKKVIVKVNDRGPFEGNRLIDLSYVAAKKLGMLGHGTALVDVRAIDTLHYDRNINVHLAPVLLAKDNASQNLQPKLKVAFNKKPANHPTFYLQVGAFKNKFLAERLRNRIHVMVPNSEIRITNPALNLELYRVQIGPIKDIATASRITQRLKAAGLPSKQLLQNPLEA